MSVFEIREVKNPDEKTCICNNILRALPNWFGNEPAIVDYTIQVRTMRFFGRTNVQANPESLAVQGVQGLFLVKFLPKVVV